MRWIHRDCGREVSFAGGAAGHEKLEPKKARKDTPRDANNAANCSRAGYDKILLHEKARLNRKHASAFIFEHQCAAMEAERVGDDLVVAMVFGEMPEAAGPLLEPAHFAERHEANFGG